MTAFKEKKAVARTVVLTAVLALTAAACGGEMPASPGETDGAGSPTSSPGGSPVSSPVGQPGELETYTLGIFQDVTTDNAWNFNDTAGGTVWNQYFLSPTTAAAYTIAMPGIDLQPALADADLEPARQEGDVWIGEFTLRDDLLWSDGESITAEDVAFTWQTAVDFELLGGWEPFTSPQLITSVEAVDELTVRVTFNAQPGLANWGPGSNGPHLMPIMPEHFWGPVVEEARDAEDPRTELISASGAEAPAAGPTIFSERQEGSFAASVANPNYYDQGAEITSGDVTWTEGPFADEFQFPLYGGQEPAVLALANGEVDLLLNPLGMQRGFQDQVTENPDLTAIVNPTNGFRFLAFNHAREPMSDPAFRDALTALINKEFVTEQLLQGVAFPLYVIVPEGNTAWYNEEVAGELAEQGYAGLEDNERRQVAIDLLTDAGYSWETAPAIAEDGTFTAGQGLIGPDGEPVPQLELVTPTASYDPLRATFGNYISGVAQEMGMPVVAIPTDFNKIIADVFAVDEDNNYTSDFDMFILGYSLGNPAFPTFHQSFFASDGDSNNTQYASEEYDAALAAFNSAQTVEEAYDAMWEMERLIATDKPHVPLFDTGILEFYNNRVQYPFTETLHGLHFLSGQQSAVRAR